MLKMENCIKKIFPEGAIKSGLRWDGESRIYIAGLENWALQGESIVSLHPYFRGRSVLAPSQDECYDVDQINDIATSALVLDGSSAEWICDTVGNKSTLHPSTSSIVFEIEGNLNTKLYFKMNQKDYRASIGDLLEYGYVCEMEYYHSQAFKIHPALPCSRYQFEMELEDNHPEQLCDVYHMEISQKNRQWAYISPVYVRTGL